MFTCNLHLFEKIQAFQPSFSRWIPSGNGMHNLNSFRGLAIVKAVMGRKSLVISKFHSSQSFSKHNNVNSNLQKITYFFL